MKPVKLFIFLLFLGVIGAVSATLPPAPVVSSLVVPLESSTETLPDTPLVSSNETEPAVFIEKNELPTVTEKTKLQYDVPFYSQFTDITSTEWQKVGCGIASIAMLIDYHSSEAVNVDLLLQEGIKANAYIEEAGWTHAGLIKLTKPYGLNGESVGLAHLTMNKAFAELKTEVSMNPVIVSVHYTFDKNNPIPHLVVVTGIDEEFVYYNDPAEPNGQNRINIKQFQSAWKKRFITIHQA